MKNLILMLLVISGSVVNAQTSINATDIIEKAYHNERSGTYSLRLQIKISRPGWNREISLKTWASSGSRSMMLVTDPAKDKGIAFLRIKTEGWNWLPSVERVIKISPSQMAQPWMGSDFSNEDLLKEASILQDYTHTYVTDEMVDGVLCYKIKAIPKPGASVVWGFKIVWVGKQDLLERKTENYDERGTLISTLLKSSVKDMGGRKIPTSLTMISHTKQHSKTMANILGASFNINIADHFFTQENMKKLK